MYQSRVAKTTSATRFRVVRPVFVMERQYVAGDTLDAVAAGVPPRVATLLWRAHDLDELDDEVVPDAPPPAKASPPAARVAPRGR